MAWARYLPRQAQTLGGWRIARIVLKDLRGEENVTVRCSSAGTSRSASLYGKAQRRSLLRFPFRVQSLPSRTSSPPLTNA